MQDRLGPKNDRVAPARPAQADPIVSMVDVRKRFGALAAVDGISLSVMPGEILGIIGRSGAGKSTLIRCLNGLERPESGRVEILGQSLDDLSEPDLRLVRGRIGMIFQHFNLLSSKTVAENVALPLKIAGVPATQRRARIADMLHLVGLDAKTNAYPAQLSGGQKQRVGIARALAASPALLLSDEATSALDPETTASILDLLRDINRQLGLTIVLITHEMSVIRALAQRVIVLDKGQIAEQGPTQRIFTAPATELTRRLIGSDHRHAALSPDRLSPTYQPGHFAMLRMVLQPSESAARILSALATAFGREPLLLDATLDPINGRIVQTLTLAVFDADAQRITTLRETLALPATSIELVGYAQHPL
ncbi:ATP-binding cassette domain-containing protein [Lichenihabitans psoromatis]|uniref:methionine ABC transporter ATP-binding protein n=1 Tax=Lichenihabitans psoromatis TaxID=2528642 RepID=UPI0010383232